MKWKQACGIVLGFTGFLLAGCPTTGVDGVGDRLVPFIADSNVEYIDAIVPHHEMALQMAQREVEAGARADVRAMAAGMVETQTAEIAALKDARARLTGTRDTPEWPADSHMVADMELLMATSGTDLDGMFLQHMIEHHSSGISIAHRALPQLTEPDLIENATSVEEMQSREIGAMRDLLDE